MNDPIADLLIRINNAQKIRADYVDIPHSKLKEEIVKILVAEGYAEKFDSLKRMDKKFLRLTLKYDQSKKGIITGLKRVSKLGRRVYRDARSLPKVLGGFGTAIVTTSKGVMTEASARSQKIGGEVICYIW